MKVLVTGGAGFIGSHLVERLIVAGHGVVVLDDLSSGSKGNLHPGIPLLVGDIRQEIVCADAMKKERPECVVHLAAQSNVRRSIEDPCADAEVNVLGTLNVLRSSALNGVRRVIYASSGGAIYGNQAEYPCRESDVPRPLSPYGISKLAGEHYGRYFAEGAGLEFTALRLANVYGPRQNPRGESGIVALFLREMFGGRNPRILGDGGQTRDFVWIGDVVDAFMCAIAGPQGVCNIGTSRETSVNELFNSLKEIVAFQGDAFHSPAIGGEVRRNALSYERAQGTLGWAPRTDLRKGLLETARVQGRAPSCEMLGSITKSAGS